VNSRNQRKAVTALFLGSLGLVTLAQTSRTIAPSPVKAVPKAQAMVHYAQLPLSFEPNRGQTSANVQWLARGPEYTLFLGGSDAVLQLNQIVPGKRGAVSPRDMMSSINSSAVRMSLLGAGSSPQSAGEDLQSGKANYFTGNDPAKWQHDVPMYGKVRTQSVYPGVDLVYYGHRGELEYDFVVAPGADASAIKLRFDGAKPALAVNGDLVLPVEGGPEVRFNKPVVYQMKDGARQPVDGSFVIADGKQGQQVSFHLGAYDHSRELVIDPTLVFVGALGTGNYETEANGMAVDASGEIILTGLTGDVNFPTTTGAYQTVCNQYSAVAIANGFKRCGNEVYNGSAFVTKISADGTSLVYSTYLHGLSGLESGVAVAVDSAGDAVVLGDTGSNDFPITANAYPYPTTQSLCSPYYQPIGVDGGSPSDFYQPAAAHCDGYNSSGEWGSGGPTIFIAKLDPTGSNLLYSTFFGGTNQTYATSLALDSSDNIYFTSYLQGAEEYLSGGVPVLNVYPQNGTVPFPVTASAFQSASVSQQVATLSELSADGQTLLYSTLFASTNNQNPQWIQPLSLAVGPNGIAYVGGWAYSDSVPTTAGSVRPACVDNSVYNGGHEYGTCEGYTGFLAAFDTTQSGQNSLKYATYIGGPEVPGGNSPQDQVLGLAADSANNVYVTGFTVSPAYPVTAGAYDSTCTAYNAGNLTCNDTGFLTKINPTGSAYVWSTYFGGNNDSSSQGQAIAFDAAGLVYLYGYDSNYTYDLPLVSPLEGRPGNGSSYAFVATFSADGTQLLFSTPLGNSSPSAGNIFPVPNNGIALDASGDIYFAAYGSDSGTFPTTTGAYDTTAVNGGIRSFFGKISPVFAPSGTTLNISPSTATTGQTVTFTATVAGTTQSTPTPTGTVTLTNSSAVPVTTLGTITLAGGTGQFTTSSLGAGSYSVTGSYSGDGNYQGSTSSPQSLTVSSTETATVTLGSLAQIYAGVPLAATATTSSPSGLPLTFTYSGTGGTTYGPTSTAPTAAGSYTVVATVSNPNYLGSATGTLVISPALLTATANNGTMVAGTAVPALTASYNGFVPGDTVAVLSGSPALSTTANSSSPAALYPITIVKGTLSAANYSFAFVNGTMLVSPAPTASIAISAKLTGSAAAGYTATVTATNSGAGAAANAQLTTASLGSATGSGLPISFGTIAASGGTSTVVVNIPGSAGANGAAVVQRLAGSYTGGSFSSSSKVTLP
jgi:hypothetical protein